MTNTGFEPVSARMKIWWVKPLLQFAIMRTFTLCCKRYNAQYTSTKTQAKPVRTDNAIQEMLANSFLIGARKELCLKRPTVVRLQQRRGRYNWLQPQESNSEHKVMSLIWYHFTKLPLMGGMIVLTTALPVCYTMRFYHFSNRLSAGADCNIFAVALRI